MKKQANESWLHYWMRCAADLVRDKSDARYWAGILGTTGAACLAVAFVEGSSIAFYAGIACCLQGLKFHRKGAE